MKQPANASLRDTAKAALADKEETHFPHSHPETVDPVTGEVTVAPANGATALIAEADEDLFYNPAYAEFDVVRQVTVPVLRWQAGQAIVCRIDTAMKLGKDISKETKMAPPHLFVATLLSRGRARVLRTIIAGAVLKEELEMAYPADGYVGKWFTIKKLPRERFMNEKGEMTERRYSLYQIIQIDDASGTLAIPNNAGAVT